MKLIQVQNSNLSDWLSLPRFARLHNEINRLFDAPLTSRALSPEFVPGWTPALEVREEAENFVVQIELPGVKREAVTVTYQEGVLSIAGERKQEQVSEAAAVYRAERRYGRFQRNLELLKPVAADKIKASYLDGVLTITLPKTEEAKPKQINIQVN